MQKVITANGYDYYEGVDNSGKKFYNLVPEGQPAPAGGYAAEHICKVKGVPNLFKESVGLTKSQLLFFKKPRTMADIMNILFKGDAWAANDFQNQQINAGNLEVCEIENPSGKQYNTIIAIKLKPCDKN